MAAISNCEILEVHIMHLGSKMANMHCNDSICAHKKHL